MLDYTQLRDLIIKPALYELLLFSEPAVDLLLFTCANESNGGTYLKQINGNALGIYQMEPETYIDIWQNHITNKQSLMTVLFSNFDLTQMPSEDRMIYDLRFATAMARIHYQRVKEPLPSSDPEKLWDYYKKYYNTPNGKAMKSTALFNYRTFTNQRLASG